MAPGHFHAAVTGMQPSQQAALTCLLSRLCHLAHRYSPDVDWRDQKHWHCNDNVHPSRHGTYDGITFHPHETIFVPSAWHVADPYTRRYSIWGLTHLRGDPGTGGRYNKELYKYAIRWVTWYCSAIRWVTWYCSAMSCMAELALACCALLRHVLHACRSMPRCAAASCHTLRR
jgi:hypothetical protein